MSSPTNHNSIRIALAPGNTAAFLQAMRAAVDDDATATLLIDMSQVIYADPATLESLSEALERACQGGREVWLDHVSSDVYKALQLAKLGGFFRRVHHGLTE